MIATALVLAGCLVVGGAPFVRWLADRLTARRRSSTELTARRAHWPRREV